MSHNLTQKLKQSLAKNKQIKITFTAPGNVQNLINEYLEYYNSLEGERISADLLLSNIIESALGGEKEFQKWRRGVNKTATKTVTKMSSNTEPKSSATLPLN